MKRTFFLLLVMFNIHAFGQDDATPAGYKIITEKVGDLDNDNIVEKVIVFDSADSTEDGFIRELRIYKLDHSEWKLWKQSRNAILKSQEGGMMGDPFQGFNIINGLLVIKFSGGSSWKWFYTDKYRFQNNEFELVGYSYYFGKLCEYWEDVDFNLSTGKIIYKKEFENCDKGQQVYKTEKETFFKKGISINIGNRNLQEKRKIITPKYKCELEL